MVTLVLKTLETFWHLSLCFWVMRIISDHFHETHINWNFKNRVEGLSDQCTSQVNESLPFSQSPDEITSMIKQTYTLYWVFRHYFHSLSLLTLWVPGVFLIICSRGPEIHLCFLQNFADKTTDGKIRFSISFLVSFELFFQELFFGHKECFIQPYLPRAFSRWKNARRASHVYIRGWPPRGVTQNTYIYVVGTQRVKRENYIYLFFTTRSWKNTEQSFYCILPVSATIENFWLLLLWNVPLSLNLLPMPPRLGRRRRI